LHRNPHIVYPGNIQGRHRNEAGAKGFYDVRLDGAETELKFIRTSAVNFDSMNVSCNGILHMNELIDACTAAAGQYTAEGGAVIGVLRLTDLDADAAELLS